MLREFEKILPVIWKNNISDIFIKGALIISMLYVHCKSYNGIDFPKTLFCIQ